MSRGRGTPARSAEMDLLLCAARTHITPAGAARMEALCRGNLDWARVRGLSARHRVTPLVASQLKATCAGAVPAAELQGFARTLRRNAVRNLQLTRRLLAVLDRFKAEGIRALVFRGPVMAVSAYGSLALRMFYDVDLLVRREEVAAASAVLAALGFRPTGELDAAQEAALLDLERPRDYVDDASGLSIDLHWAVTPRYFMSRIGLDQIHDEVEVTPLMGRAVPGFAPEVLLPLLTVHGAKHQWDRLLWVCDLAALIGACEHLSWNKVQALARAWHCERILGIGLTLARRLLEAPVPDDVLHGFTGSRTVRSLAARAEARLLGAADPPGAFGSARFHLGMMEAWPDRLRYLRFIVRPSEADWRMIRLPGPLGFLYYALRPFRLLAGSGESVHPARDDR